MTAEIERFLADAQTDAGLRAEFASADLDAAVKLANARGYKISRADADAYLDAKSELSDGQLDHVAGGGHKKKHKDDDGGLRYPMGKWG